MNGTQSVEAKTANHLGRVKYYTVSNASLQMTNSQALMYETWIWTKFYNWLRNGISDMRHMCPLYAAAMTNENGLEVWGNSPCPELYIGALREREQAMQRLEPLSAHSLTFFIIHSLQTTRVCLHQTLKALLRKYISSSPSCELHPGRPWPLFSCLSQHFYLFFHVNPPCVKHN